MLYAILLWLSTSWVVGYFGRRRALGFWGVFIFSLLFSPAVGLLALLIGRSSQANWQLLQKHARLVAQYRSLSKETADLRDQTIGIKQQIATLEAVSKIPDQSAVPG